ncbi:hypothetical protein [Paraburkholderia aspalathi]|uniref:hypothetical protein n=1 Tax=Paraburkholderia aspalathi TaxID=1324617 RepID=UPI0038BD4713
MPIISSATNSNVSFASPDHSIEQDDAKDLANFHDRMVENCPTYARSVNEATNGSTVKISVSNVFDQAGITSYNEKKREHLIEINPSIDFSRGLRKDKKSRKEDARLSLAFEMQNAASSRKFDALDKKAQRGGFALSSTTTMLPVEQKLARSENDKAAVLYARETEKQEFLNTKNVAQISEELENRRLSGWGNWEFESSSFDAYYKHQIDDGHTQQYLELYDEFTKRR